MKNLMRFSLDKLLSETYPMCDDSSKVSQELAKSLDRLIARFYHNQSLVEKEDLWQECYLIILTSCSQYKPTQGNLKSYVVGSVQKGLCAYFRKIKRQKGMFLHRDNKATRLEKFRQEWELERGRLPTLTETRHYLKWSSEKIFQAEISLQRKQSPLSLDENPCIVFTHQAKEDPYQPLVEWQLTQTIAQLLKTLTPFELRVLTKYYPIEQLNSSSIHQKIQLPINHQNPRQNRFPVSSLNGSKNKGSSSSEKKKLKKVLAKLKPQISECWHLL